MFAFRAHNAVNARLHKPVYGTLTECMDVLRNNIKNRSAADYRVAYLNHIARYWTTIQDITGIVALKKVQEMRKIEAEYFSQRDTKFSVVLKEDSVIIPRNWVEIVSESPVVAPSPVISTSNTRAGFRIVGGRMRLRQSTPKEAKYTGHIPMQTVSSKDADFQFLRGKVHRDTSERYLQDYEREE